MKRDSPPVAMEIEPVREEALLVVASDSASPNDNIAKVLGFFGVPSRSISAAELLRGLTDQIGARLFCSAEAFLEIVNETQAGGDESLADVIHSVFVFAGQNPDSLLQVTKLFANDVSLSPLDVDDARELRVSDDAELWGAMAGLTIRPSANHPGHVMKVPQAIPIISMGDGLLFLRLEWRGVPLFITVSGEVIDLELALPRGLFNIREHALAALPVVLYTKWAFANSCWQVAEASACIIIDDPLLRPRHGFIEFQELLGLLKRHRFSANVAFIPWNWRRNRPETVKLFRDNADCYSISIHGCDHTSAEFGSGNFDLLYRKSENALQRMSAHEEKTGIEHDRVMVFPHGAFSEAALAALKHTRFIAAAGSEIISTDPHPRPITVGDVWNTAVMCYSSFPIFSRRSPYDGIENVAFDLLLGKPAVISIHHDFCLDHCRHLTAFVDSLNALKCPLAWRSLGELVRRSFREREVSSDTIEVEMYASELRLQNLSGERRQYRIHKRESDPAVIEKIEAGGREIEWRFSVDRVRFEIELTAGESVLVRVAFTPLKATASGRRNLTYEMRTMFRRYACELRDNYIVTNKVAMPDRLRQRLVKGSESITHMQFFSENGTMIADKGLMSPHSKRETLPSLPEQRVSVALENFTQWLNRYGETSWDHQSYFAGPLGSRAKALYYRRRLAGTIAVAPMILSEGFLPGARRLFHRRMRLPIADAHYAMAFAFLFQTNGEPGDFERAVHFLDELEKSRCRGFGDYCWGYPFDWVTRGGTIPRETPLITTTPYAYEAFLQAYEIEPRPRWKEILASIAQHAAHDIKSFPTSEKASSSSYTPSDSGGVINAAAYRASLLTSAAQVLGRDGYKEIAERNLYFVLETQNADGSWYYATDGVRDFVDHFHTCFVLKALAKIERLDPSSDTDKALENGIDYYLRSLFDEEGMPKPFAKAPRLTVYKRELYDCAECVNLCLLLRGRFPQLNNTLETVVDRILNRWVKEDGSFRSRRLHLGWDNVPMHRWGQSQMFRSLAFYLRETMSERPRAVESAVLSGDPFAQGPMC